VHKLNDRLIEIRRAFDNLDAALPCWSRPALTPGARPDIVGRSAYT
jgi:hypothetical protein